MVDVSLVMPARDVQEAWIVEAARTALDERRCEVELIVVDDGSRVPVERPLAAISDERLRVIRIAPSGPYAARDAGIAIARGRSIRFLDADDVIAPGSTARLHALLGDRDDVIAYGQTAVCDEHLVPHRTIRSSLEGDVTTACLLGGFHARVVSMVFPRRVVDLAGPWAAGFSISGDWDWVLRALDHASARCDPGVATSYRRHAGSLTRKADVAAGDEARQRIIDRYLDRHPEARGTELEREARLATAIDRALAHASAGSTTAALRRLYDVARLDRLAAARVGPRVAGTILRTALGGAPTP